MKKKLFRLLVLFCIFLTLGILLEDEIITRNASKSEYIPEVISMNPEMKKVKSKYIKSGSLRNKEYMESFYHPKTIGEVSAERSEYLSLYGSFNSLGEINQDNPPAPWVSVGPNGINQLISPFHYFSGRIISFAMHGDNTNILYCGGASGGLWKSTNAGSSWFNLLDTLACPSISSIAVTQLASDNTIYFSTGAGFNGAGPQIARAYRSTNGGSSWTRITSIPDNTLWIQKIEVNKFNKNHVFIATDNGLYRSVNGLNFTKVYNNPAITDVITYTNLILPDTLNIVMARNGEGIYRSTNGGLNFNLVTLPSYNTSADGRITLTNTPGTSMTYALVGNSQNQRFLGIWSSSDKGATWIKRNFPTADSGSQSSYNQGIGVAPNGRVYCGYNGREVYYSTNQGTSWTASNFTHEDIQRIHVYSNTLVYNVSDGGIFKSTNGGVDWVNAGGNWLPLSQSYTLTASESDPNALWSGLQDNGLMGGYNSFNAWVNYACCDGGDYLRVGAYQYLSLVGLGDLADHRYQRKLISAPVTDSWEPFSQGIPAGQPWTAAGMNDFLYDTSYFFTSMAQFVYRRLSSASTWSQLGTRPHPTANIFIGRILSKGLFLLAGFDIPTSPQIRIYNPNSTAWETPNLSNIPAGTRVTDFDKGSQQKVYMTLSGTSGARIFRSTNNGYVWTNITGNFPNFANTSSILVSKTNENVIYAGSDFGVYATTNGGVNWFKHSQGMPAVCFVRDLEFSAGNNFVYAATYGRGVFKTDVLTDIPAITSGIPERYSLHQNYPNPFNPETKIIFEIPQSEKGRTLKVSLIVYDVSGKVIERIVNSELSAGKYEYTFDASGLTNGVYFYRLITEEFTETRKMMLIK